MNFSSRSDFVQSLSLSALQISPVVDMFPVLAELLLLDSGCKNNFVRFLSFLGNKVFLDLDYQCCHT